MASRSTTPGLDEHPLKPADSPSGNGLFSPTTTTPLLRPGSSTPPSATPTISNPFSTKNRTPRVPSDVYAHSSELGARPGSMILYRLADDPSSPTHTLRQSSYGRESSYTDSFLLPPNPQFDRGGPTSRSSTFSMGAASTRSSIISFSSDSKYPFIGPGNALSGAHLRDSTYSSAPFSNLRERGLVPYSYDPTEDEMGPPDEEDLMHDPSSKLHSPQKLFPWRGVANISFLIFIVCALLILFTFYPVFTFLRDDKRKLAIDGNIRINATGQAPVLFGLPSLIDPQTPVDVKTRKGFDGNSYTLVFSDEFEIPGRTFHPGDDPFWEAVDLWYGVTGDIEWYDPQQVTTRDGALVITIDSADNQVAGVTPNSTAPFTIAQNHQLTYRSGMLQSWNKFCFSSGYIEVGIVLPGPNENTQGYWPGAWTMGQLARPGYGGTTDGMWPYTYDSCDVGTFPNQTNKDHLGPPAALHSDWSRDKYNMELSWLSGQRLSACTCPSSDHPGPIKSDGSYKGRGAPEIDILEAELDKESMAGQVVSQSAQFAPFTHDYIYLNDTSDEWFISDPTVTRANSYRGSAVQQAVSALTRVPSNGFYGSGKTFIKYGFEYWADPSDPSAGYIQWMVDGKPTHRLSGKAVPADPTASPIGQAGSGLGGTGVGQRLIPEEPMSIVLNLGISPNWQTINLETMTFPTEMLVDYVRVYQRDGHMNIGCDPPDYPTKSYIDAHMEAYTNPNYTSWPYEKPKNRLYEGGC